MPLEAEIHRVGPVLDGRHQARSIPSRGKQFGLDPRARLDRLGPSFHSRHQTPSPLPRCASIARQVPIIDPRAGGNKGTWTWTWTEPSAGLIPFHSMPAGA